MTQRSSTGTAELPCPFCGERPTLSGAQPDVWNSDGGPYWIYCANIKCVLVSVEGESHDEVLRDWNTRAPAQPSAGDRAATEHGIDPTPMTAPDTPSREEMEKRAVAHITQWGGSQTNGSMLVAFAEAEIARLAAKTADDGVREATIEECARLVEATTLNNKNNIAREIRTLPRTKAKP